MSLDQTPEPTLQEMRGKLETIKSAWIMATKLDKRKALNEEFKALAEEIKMKYGAEGKKAVDYALAKHMELKRAHG